MAISDQDLRNMTDQERRAEHHRREKEKVAETLASIHRFDTEHLEEIRSAINRELRKRDRKQRKYLDAYGPLTLPGDR